MFSPASVVCLSVCLSVCLYYDNFRKPWRIERSFLVCAGTSSGDTGQVCIWRSSGQGQGHSSKKCEISSRGVKLRSAISQVLQYRRYRRKISTHHGIFDYGRSNDLTAIFVTWPKIYAFVGGLPQIRRQFCLQLRMYLHRTATIPISTFHCTLLQHTGCAPRSASGPNHRTGICDFRTEGGKIHHWTSPRTLVFSWNLRCWNIDWMCRRRGQLFDESVSERRHVYRQDQLLRMSLSVRLFRRELSAQWVCSQYCIFISDIALVFLSLAHRIFVI